MIPPARPSCSDLEVAYVTEVLRSGWWAMGPKVAEFEERFAAFAGAKYAVATNGCTQALHLACQALGVAGGEVIMPALTFAATGLAAVHNGARVVFADIDENTLCLDWDDARAKVTADTKAVIPVWYGGTVAAPLRWQPHIPVIEDCAHAAGNPLAGTAGIASCWSFAAMKNIATGDGGMITTNDPDLAAAVRRLRFFGITHDTWPAGHPRRSWDFDIPEAGHKANMNDITAAIGLAQLERLPGLNKARAEIACRYLDELGGLGWLRLLAWRPESSWHLFPVRVGASRRDDFIAWMLRQGVFCRVHYRPLNTYEIFGEVALPVTDRVAAELVSLPLFPDMTPLEQEQVVDAVKAFRW